jgi:beta-N-acetylhexosaminidase
MKGRILTMLLGVLPLIFLGFEQPVQPQSGEPDHEAYWVDSVFQQMSEDERIGQLFMIRAHSNLGQDHIDGVKRMIRQYHVGGLCFFQGTAQKQAVLTNEYQALAKRVPLMIAMDAEWGLGMRLKTSTISYPRQLMLGAIRDNRLIYDMGARIAEECRRLGVHINFAPVADVNNNANNPVINTRSFGEDRYNVAVKSYMYMNGMQDHKVMASAKHFPGHGDTDVDSHYDLPVIMHGMNRIDSLELFPFKILIEQGVGSMMVAHLSIPAIDDTEHLPTTLSPKVVRQLLQQKLGFEGLIFTDGLGMQGVLKHHNPGQLEVKALMAGNDVLLLPQNIPAAFREISQALQEGKLPREQFRNSVKKVLRAKYRLGLTRPQQVALENLDFDLNHPKGLALKRELIQNALTLVRNRESLIPFRSLEESDMGSLSIGATSRTPFQERLAIYKEIEHFYVSKGAPYSKMSGLLNKLAEKDIVIVSLHDLSNSPSKGFGVTETMKEVVRDLSQRTKVVLVLFGNPYALKYFDGVDWVLEAYDEDLNTQDLAAQGLFGAFGFRGQLPVTASLASREKTGVQTKPLFRLSYGIPEEVGLYSQKLLKIDTVVANAIDSGAMPGCVVLVAKDGKVVFHKAYGHHTYKNGTKVGPMDVYDLASITKIASTTLSIMKLHEEGQIDVRKPINTYLTELDSTNKVGLSIQEIMAHRAGLKPWIPFYKQTVSGRKNPLPAFYRKQSSGKYSVPVTDQLYMISDFKDTIWQQIYTSDLLKRKEYRYSDLGFYMMAALVDRMAGIPINHYSDQEFYRPMGLQSTTYNPLQRIPKSLIPPTEEDRYFRNQRVQGYVHDMGAAMLGGVSGHAGLFSNASDLAALMQMLLNKGYYGGQQYLQPETVDLFTQRCQGCTRRGIGFDMKQTDPFEPVNMSEKASSHTFGHLGFTGTCAWVDPEHQLVYIFLSNRTYPSMRNNLLGKMDIRPRIQTAIYDALEYYSSKDDGTPSQ